MDRSDYTATVPSPSIGKARTKAFQVWAEIAVAPLAA